MGAWKAKSAYPLVMRWTLVALIGCSFDAQGKGVPSDSRRADGPRTRVDASSDGPRADASRADASRADARAIDAASVDAKPVDAASIDAKPVDAAPIDAPPASCPNLFQVVPGIAGDKGRYWFSGDGQDALGYFEEARPACEAKGGYLYIPSDAQEHASIGQWIGNGGNPRRPYVGIYRQGNGWMTVLGQVPQFLDWANNEPDMVENYVIMERVDPWELYGDDNDLRRPFVCECTPTSQ